MEPLTLITAILGAVFSALLFDAVRSISNLFRGYRSEKLVAEKLALLSFDEKFRNRMVEILTELQRTENVNRRALDEAEEMIKGAMAEVGAEARKAVEQGLEQPSERGRVNYAAKLLEESAAKAQASGLGVQPQ
jgi:uncharacterized protein YajQ (UPF0234 family)